MRCILAVAERLRPDKVLVQGDWMDNEKFSNHAKATLAEIQAHRYQEVIDSIRYYLDELQKHGADLIYLEGNHEAWVERWCVKNAGIAAPDVYEVMAPEHVLGKNRKRFTWVPYVQRDITKYEIAPNLWACHGWATSKHAAAAHMAKVPGVSIVYGHTHRAEHRVTRDPRTGKPVHGWSPGSLCHPQPMYLHGAPSEWTLGFSILYQSRRDPEDWTPYTITIHEGRCILPDGTEIVGEA